MRRTEVADEVFAVFPSVLRSEIRISAAAPNAELPRPESPEVTAAGFPFVSNHDNADSFGGALLDRLHRG